MRLIFVTQRVDSGHPALAATIPKIRALSERVDELVVLAQSGCAEELPGGVELRTFDADTRLGRGVRFERALGVALPADAVVAHMIPLYVVLAAPLVLPRRTPLVLWFTHWRASALLRLAARLATAIVSVDRRSFPLDSAKVRPIGHGIDVSEFPCVAAREHRPLRAVVLGRYSPAKGLPTILEAVRAVDGLELELHGAALSDLEERHRRELEHFGVELGAAVPRAEVPRLFAQADLLVNNMRAGAPDKVVYEAAASCLPVLASNPVFDELFGELPLSFAREHPESLVERLRWLLSLSADERQRIGDTLRERVVARHSVESWADGVLGAVG
jgi:glycosyltransferase involved in cell wall biosynthesis